MADEIDGPLKEESQNITGFNSAPSSKAKSPANDTSEMNTTTSSKQEINTSHQQQPDYNSEVYQQQLQEALLVFNSHGMSQSLIAAAAAAMVSSTCTSTSSPSSLQQSSFSEHIQPESQPQQQQQQQPQQPQQLNSLDIDIAKRESIRTANRERKKKWRINNEERNKDNDLRCRVNKRASKLFGMEESEAKRLWAEDEFNKRRGKRHEKGQQKDVVSSALGDSSLQQQQQSVNTTANDLAHAFAAYPSVFDASKLLEIPSELQRHLLEQLNLALTNSKLPTSIDYTMNNSDPSQHTLPPDPTSSTNLPVISSSPSTKKEEGADTVTKGPDQQDDLDDALVKEEQDQGNQDKTQEYPIDAVLTLMQLNAGWKK